MKITIRKAIRKDMPRVLELITELAVYEKEPDAVKIKVDTLEKEGFGPNPLFVCFVAEVEGMIQGMALCYFRFSTWNGKTVHLEDLIVTQTMRGKSLGSSLYNEVMKFAHLEGVNRVEWVVLDWNKTAIDFYERTGAKLYKDWFLVQMDKKGLQKYLANS